MSLSLVPARQRALAPEGESLDTGEEADNRQYQHVLSVASSQERRLVKFGALRLRPGYDLSDPWLVSGDNDGDKKKRKREPLVLGAPCRLIGSDALVAYLGPAPGQADSCNVRSLSGAMTTHARRELLPLPTCQARQGDWAFPVNLTGEQARWHGHRGLCGLCGSFPGDSARRGVWVSFEPADPTHPPEMVLLDAASLVTLPLALGATRTPWESRCIGVEASSELPALTDEDTKEQQLALQYGDEDKDDAQSSAGSVQISDDESSDEEEAAVVKHAASGRYGRVVRSQFGTGGRVLAVRFFDTSERPEEIPEKSLESCSVERLELEATCRRCGSAEPEAELLLCDRFAKDCLTCVHIACLPKPLKKVPEGAWFCEACATASVRGAGQVKAVEGPAKTTGKADTAASKTVSTAKAKAAAPKVAAKAKAATSGSGAARGERNRKPLPKAKTR